MAKHGKKVYIDVCALSRPFDDQSMMRIRLETDAYHLIIQAVQEGELVLVSSPVHDEEVRANPNPSERHEILLLLDRYAEPAEVDKQAARKRAEFLHSRGLGVADAAHVTVAEAAAEHFITCDDRLLKQCARLEVDVQASNPVEFCIEENLE